MGIKNTYENDRVTNNRSSLLVLSSSKDDGEDERIYSIHTTTGGDGTGAEVVDPRTLIQFKEME